ncbi:MAG: hypothetical protein ACI4JY_08785 [Oscillospiraceae bacterium]
MKNLANCSPVEFLVQTNKIKNAVASWIELTKIKEIRKNLPQFDENATEEEKKTATEKQIKQNLSDILNSILEEHPVETAELLGLMCFIEPSDLENHKMSELLGSFSELMNCDEVISFFISLAQLGQKYISD